MENVLFIHIPKTAGTTIRTVLNLGEYRQLDQIESVFPQPEGQHVSFGHVSYKKLVEAGFIDPEFDRTSFKFTFVRDPYDRAVSLYQYYLKTGKIQQRTFRNFLETLHALDLPSLGLYNQKDWSQCNPQVRWIEGIDVDFIGFFEHLDHDLKIVADKIGVDLPEKLPRLNKTVDKPLDSYYDVHKRRLVNSIYEEDFRRFGYNKRT